MFSVNDPDVEALAKKRTYKRVNAYGEKKGNNIPSNDS